MLSMSAIMVRMLVFMPCAPFWCSLFARLQGSADTCGYVAYELLHLSWLLKTMEKFFIGTASNKGITNYILLTLVNLGSARLQDCISTRGITVNTQFSVACIACTVYNSHLDELAVDLLCICLLIICRGSNHCLLLVY